MSRIRQVFGRDFHRDFMKRQLDTWWLQRTCGGLFPPTTKGRRDIVRRLFVCAMIGPSQRCNLHEVVGEHGRRDPQLESLSAFSETALHAATAEQHRDAPLDAGAKALAVLELPALLICLALGCFGAAALWDAHHLDAILFARRHVVLAEEPAIASIQVGSVAEGLLVAF